MYYVALIQDFLLTKRIAFLQILRLDTLGNVLDADIPLMDIMREQVVVKKFVYDEEVEPEPPKPSAAKSTKGKGKKAKQ